MCNKDDLVVTDWTTESGEGIPDGDAWQISSTPKEDEFNVTVIGGQVFGSFYRPKYEVRILSRTFLRTPEWPNWFWRLWQYLIFGWKWSKIKDA